MEEEKLIQEIKEINKNSIQESLEFQKTLIKKSEQLNTFFKSLEANSQRINEAMKWAERNAKSVNAFARVMQSNAERIKLAMSWFEQYAGHINKLRSSFTQFEQLIASWNEVNRICFERGWFPHADWGADAGRTILKLYKEKKYDELDGEICEFYSNERIGGLVEAWRSKKTVSPHRLDILEQAINSHLNENYSIATIVLLSQVEGCIRDILKNYGKENHKKLVRKFKQNVINSTVSSGQILKVEQVFDLIINKIFDEHGYNKKTGEIKFSRHSVLHGFYVNNFDRQKSSKLILLLNFIVMNEVFIRDIGVKQGSSVRN